MPKMKSRKAMRKRFKVTASGKLKRHSPNFRHLRAKKSAKRKKNLAKAKYVDQGQEKKYKIMMLAC
jgi:large subunit ribosomal protein L35